MLSLYQDDEKIIRSIRGRQWAQLVSASWQGRVWPLARIENQHKRENITPGLEGTATETSQREKQREKMEEKVKNIQELWDNCKR